MPKRAKWRRDGTSATPKAIDLRLDGLKPDGRLQLSSGVCLKTAYELRVNALREAWALGGIWRESVQLLKAKRYDLDAWYQAKQQGADALAALKARSGAELLTPVIRDYLKQSRATDKRKMQQRLNRFARSLGKAPSVSDVTTASVEAFLSGLTDQRTTTTTKTPAAGSTVNRYRAVIGGLCTWAVKVGRMPTHPIAGKKVEKRPEPLHRLPELSAAEYRGYMNVVVTLRPDLEPFFLLLIHTAPDVGELYEHATARDLDAVAGTIRYQRTKTARFGALPRRVPMPEHVRMSIAVHCAEHDLTGSLRLFAMFQRADIEWTHQRACTAIQRPELTLKDLRHVAAIAWVKAGVHIRLVQKWLGHTSLSQTMKYTDYEPDATTAGAMAERAAATLRTIPDLIPAGAAEHG